MRFGKIGMAAVTALSLVSTPVLAKAATPARAGVQTADQSNFNGRGNRDRERRGGGIIIALLAAAAIIIGIIIIADDDDDQPTSP